MTRPSRSRILPRGARIGTLRTRFCSASCAYLPLCITCSRHSPYARSRKINTTMYCTAVSRTAETFSSRPNINPQFLPAGIGPQPEIGNSSDLEGYCKRYLYSNLQPVLPKILQRKRKFSTRMLVVINGATGVSRACPVVVEGSSRARTPGSPPASVQSQSLGHVQPGIELVTPWGNNRDRTYVLLTFG